MGGRGRGAYYKAKYGRGGWARNGGSDHNNRDYNNRPSNNARVGGSLYDAMCSCDGKGYGAYKDLKGKWTVNHGRLQCDIYIDNVQADPFAPPSRMRVRIDSDQVGYPDNWTSNKIRVTALCDYIARRMWNMLNSGQGSYIQDCYMMTWVFIDCYYVMCVL